MNARRNLAAPAAIVSVFGLATPLAIQPAQAVVQPTSRVVAAATLHPQKKAKKVKHCGTSASNWHGYNFDAGTKLFHLHFYSRAVKPGKTVQVCMVMHADKNPKGRKMINKIGTPKSDGSIKWIKTADTRGGKVSAGATLKSKAVVLFVDSFEYTDPTKPSGVATYSVAFSLVVS